VKLSFDSQSLLFDGRRAFFFSGEMHYFRVPAADWRRRMRLWKEAGGNFIGTYVPWIVHEPEEGRIVFGDCPGRDLAAFLRTAAEEGLQVLMRPGPYVYSELVSCGLPPWLYRDYPALRWKRPDGTDEGPFGVKISYMHPLFLEKARRWFRAVDEQVRPFLAENGGPVAAVQLDNELAGIHFWSGGPDANPETFGVGREDGRWSRWLARKYGSVAAANEAYDDTWNSFAEIPPITEARPDAPVGEERRRRDFYRCYREQLLEFLATLKSWLREDGVDTPLVHNCGSRNLLHLFEGACEALGPDFLLGYDQYYALGPAWPQEHPTNSVAIDTHCNVDLVRALGWPAVGMEIQGGSYANFPPVLREDLLAFYMTHLAAGAKGINLYILTGGPNFRETGQSSDSYDYNAPIRADGSLNATYQAVADFGRFIAERRDLLEAERVAAVQVGFEWETLRLGDWTPPGCDGLSCAQAQSFAKKGILSALAATPYPGAWTELRQGALDPRRPLFLPAAAMMSESAQRAVVAFLEAGGRLFLAPWAPLLDQDLRPCTILRDFLRLPERHRIESPNSPIVVDGVRVFGCGTPRLVVDAPPPGADSPMTNARAGGVCGWWQKAGAGEVCVFGTEFTYSLFQQAEMLERILARMGAKPVARSSNRNILVDTHRHPDGRRTVFLSNLHASPQSTHLTLFQKGLPAERDFNLAPMQVAVTDFDP
jgi:beta-galactosidase